jgi:hypothetical protein
MDAETDSALKRTDRIHGAPEQASAVGGDASLRQVSFRGVRPLTCNRGGSTSQPERQTRERGSEQSP